MTAFYMVIAIDFAVAFLVGASIIRMLLYVSYKNQLFDMPGDRKVHTHPIPRLGGMSFMPTLMLVVAISMGILYRANLMPAPDPNNIVLVRLSFMLGSAMLLYVVGILDDMTDLNFKIKLAVQFIAASLMASSGLWLNNFYGLFGIYSVPFYIGMPFTVLLMVLITNAINMIDGIDGLASSIAIITLGLLTFIYLRERRFIFSTVSATMLGTLLAFWLYNMFGSQEKHTKLYMGDTGALTLGLILCFLIVSLCHFTGRNGLLTNGKYFAILFSSLSIPILEVPRLFVTRIIKGKSPFEADANHIHHRLMRCGLSSRQALWIILAMDVAIVALTAAMTRVLSITAIFLIDTAIYVIIQLAIARKVKLDTLPKE